jgi:hypothetical protein
LDAYRAEYAELYQVWRNLDTKAQGATAIAGIFVAGAFAFAEDFARSNSIAQKAVIGVFGFALGLSVLLSLSVLSVKTRWSAHVGRNIERLATDLLDLEDCELSPRLARFLGDQAMVWRMAVTSLRGSVASKSILLKRSQFFLGIGIVLAIVLTFTRVFFVTVSGGKLPRHVSSIERRPTRCREDHSRLSATPSPQ